MARRRAMKNPFFELLFITCAVNVVQNYMWSKMNQKSAKTITCGTNVVQNCNHVNTSHIHLELLHFNSL
jgi:hypothetical protein